MADWSFEFDTGARLPPAVVVDWTRLDASAAALGDAQRAFPSGGIGEEALRILGAEQIEAIRAALACGGTLADVADHAHMSQADVARLRDTGGLD